MAASSPPASSCDVFPSTADAPVRIDLWGDEVDRLTEFSVADQRATVSVSEVEIHPCRELRPDDTPPQRTVNLFEITPPSGPLLPGADALTHDTSIRFSNPRLVHRLRTAGSGTRKMVVLGGSSKLGSLSNNDTEA